MLAKTAFDGTWAWLKSRFTFAASLALALGAFFLFLQAEKETKVQYHLRKLEAANYALAHSLAVPVNLKGMSRFKRLRFALVQTFSPIRYPTDEVEDQTAALVQLGYFQKQIFGLASSNLVPHLYPSIMTANLKDANWSYSTKDTNVFVTAASSDIPKWRQIISNLNLRAIEPNPPNLQNN